MRLLLVILLLSVCVARAQMLSSLTTNYQSLGTVTSPLHGLTNFTVSVWASYTGDTNTATAAMFGYNQNGTAIQENIVSLSLQSGLITFGLEITNALVNVAVAPYWAVSSVHHYACVRDNNTLYLYVDGVAASSAAVNVFGPLDASGAATTIGARGVDAVVGAPWVGAIEDFRIYNKALTSIDVVNLFARPWEHIDASAMLVRTCVVQGDTGSTLTGTSRNYGSGVQGTNFGNPVVAPSKVQVLRPMGMGIP